MNKCHISEHCLFEKTVLLNNVRVTLHYLPFYPVIEVSLKNSGLILFKSKFDYRRDYDSFIDYFLGAADDDFNDDNVGVVELLMNVHC